MAAALGLPPAFAQDAASQGAEFSFDILTERMRAKAGEAYEEPSSELPEPVDALDYDEHRAIAFRPDRALWHDHARFELQAFHLGWLFDVPVRIHEVVDGRETVVGFTGQDFDYRQPLDASAFADLDLPGVAGFRLHYPLNRADVYDELVTFLGAS